MNDDATPSLNDVSGSWDRKKPMSPTVLYLILFIYGIAQRFGSTSIYNSSHFFIARVEQLNQDHLIMDYLFVTITIVRFVFLICSSPLLKWGNPLKVVIYSQIGTCLVLVSFAILAFVKASPEVFLAVVLFLVFNYALIYVIAMLGIFRFLSTVDPKFTHAYSSGQGLAGITTTATKLATLWNTGGGDWRSSLFFGIASMVVFVSIMLLRIVMKRTQHPEITGDPDDLDKLVAKSGFKKVALEYWRIYQNTKLVFWCVTIHYFQDIFLVPNFFYTVRSVEMQCGRLCMPEIFPVFNYLLYCIGDYLGKVALIWSKNWISTPDRLLQATMASFVYVPLFLFSNVHISYINYPLNRWLASDALFMIISLTFGVVKGYLSTVIVMYVPNTVRDPSDRKYASALMTHFIALGLLIGAIGSLLSKVALQAYFPL